MNVYVAALTQYFDGIAHISGMFTNLYTDKLPTNPHTFYLAVFTHYDMHEISQEHSVQITMFDTNMDPVVIADPTPITLDILAGGDHAISVFKQTFSDIVFNIEGTYSVHVAINGVEMQRVYFTLCTR